MDITTKQKKLIFIILGLGLVVFILIYGLNIYRQEQSGKDAFLSYEEKINAIMEPAQIESENCLTGELEQQGYRICCAITGGIKKGLFYDCTTQRYFEAGQLVRIIFNPSIFDFGYDSYLLEIYSDLYDEQGNKVQSLFSEAINKKMPSRVVINGIIPQDMELFTLLKLKVYPDVPVFEIGDEKVILNIEAEVLKEI